MALLDIGGDIQWSVSKSVLLTVEQRGRALAEGRVVGVLPDASTHQEQASRLHTILITRQLISGVLYAEGWRAVGQWYIAELRFESWRDALVVLCVLTGPLRDAKGRALANVNVLGAMDGVPARGA